MIRSPSIVGRVFTQLVFFMAFDMVAACGRGPGPCIPAQGEGKGDAPKRCEVRK